jgi:DNA modification methylase
MKISKLKFNPNNPRIIKDDKFKKLVKSIETFPEMMEKRPIVCVTDVDDRIYPLGGNMRLKAIQELGYKEIPDNWVTMADDWDAEKRQEFVIKDNVGFGEWDWDDLANNWDAEKLNEWGLDVPDFAQVTLEAEEDDYEIPNEIKTDIVIGDLFEIGEHRLLCGDSTDSDHVAKLMNGEKADITFTSPPYNAGNNTLGGNKNMVDNKYELYDDDIEQSDWKNFISDVLKNCLLFSENIFYNIQQLAGNKIGFIEFLYEFKNQYVDEIFWIKGHGQPAAAKNVLNSRVEHILIYRNEDCPKRTITTGDFHGTISNFYEGNGQTKNEFSEIHAATFPIHLPEFIINNFSKKSVLDVFMGTGTTMVASHQLKRKCYGMELDPKYCQVIIDRMIKLDPTLEIKRNGLPYKQTSE